MESTEVRQDALGVKRFCIDILSNAGARYCIEFPREIPDEAQIKKALLFFKHAPAWRETFSTVEPTPEWTQESTESLAEYDPVVGPYFDSLGLSVIRYNKGSNHPHGSSCSLSIKGPLPDELGDIMEKIHWRRGFNRIEAETPRGFSHLGRNAFILLLDDWVVGTLDTTGARYQVIRQPKAFFPDWPPYPKSALEESEAYNRKQAERINKFITLATFDQYVRLTSGRDTYSNMTLDQLLKLLGDDDVVEKLSQVAENPAIFAKALRWRLRGLSPMHTLEKYRIDEILHHHVERLREQAREDRKAGASTLPLEQTA